MSSTALKRRNQFLDYYLRNLAANPLLTKAVTAAVLQFSQDALSSYIAGGRPRPGKAAPFHQKLLASVSASPTSVGMGAAGLVVIGPLNHAMGLFVAQIIARSGVAAKHVKLLAILAQLLIAAPINVTGYLASAAVVNGARSVDAVLAAIHRGFWTMLKGMWVVTPASIVIASKTLSPEFWPLFFNFVGFVFGTLGATKAKKARLRAARKGKSPEDKDKTE